MSKQEEIIKRCGSIKEREYILGYMLISEINFG